MFNRSEDFTKLPMLKLGISQFSSLDKDYVYSRFSSNERIQLTDNGPVRARGFGWFICLKGTIEIEVNLIKYTLRENSIMILTPDCLVEVKDTAEALDCYMLFVSSEFMCTTNIDPNVISSLPLPTASKLSPVMTLDDSEINLLRRYYDLIHANTVENPDEIYVRSISRTLIAAMLYQVIQFASKRLKDNRETEKPRSRRSGYVSDFIKLVHEHHTRERSVGFYAGKLFISPKYLSLLVKEATGRSAAEWIDEFVILEAKNLLRFSGKNVQQVSYELNFANQSSFGKYFKHLTGMSPTEYQRS